jgi:dTMP kinase
MKSRGLFFTFDGIDGAGKSTQITAFVDWLTGQGYRVLRCRDPGSTELGEAIREILLGASFPISNRAEMLLYMASRAQLVKEVIRPALAAGTTVISDRFLLANVAYQGATGNLAPETIWSVGRVATNGLQPDMTFVLDLPVSTAIDRLPPRRDRMEQRGQAYFEAVRQGFLQQAGALGNRAHIVDATLPIEHVQEEIRRLAQSLVARQTPDV